MSKLIVEYSEGIRDVDEAMHYVLKVIDQGRISDDGKCYCYATTFENGVVVYAKRNKASDKFYVVKK